jgi:hypothetical protein
MVKSNKSLIIILSCLVIAACIFITWKGISNNDVFIESKDGKWKVGYVKAEETFDPRKQYHCILTYNGNNIHNIEYISYEYYYKGANSPASYGKCTKEEMKFPLTFGEFSDKLKSGEERIVKLEWKETGKVYKEDLVIKK